MARAIAVIKNEMTTSFMADTTIQGLYGFLATDTFDATFSKVSIESILFYIVAFAIWTVEKLFDTHASEMATLIDTKKAHRPKWYRDKALAFQFGRALIEDTDTYDVIVDSEMVVKYAACPEYQGRLYIKVAAGSTDKQPLTAEQVTALTAYLGEIKDGGVVIELVNEKADHYALEMDVYYDPMVLMADGRRLDTGESTVSDTIKDFVQNQIPFNGEYRNMSLVDVLQAVDGVVIPELKLAKSVTDSNYQKAITAGTAIPWVAIAAKEQPDSGYYKVYDDTDLTLTFHAYQTIEQL
jgi:hypothetical protein